MGAAISDIYKNRLSEGDHWWYMIKARYKNSNENSNEKKNNINVLCGKTNTGNIGSTGSWDVLVVPGSAVHSPLSLHVEFNRIWQVSSIAVFLHVHEHNTSFFEGVDNKADNVLIHLLLVYRKRELTFMIKGVVTVA